MNQTPTKHCPKCDQAKPLDDFYKNASTKDGRQVWCKPCWKADCAARKERDPDRRRAIARKCYHKRKGEGKPLHPSALSTRPYDEKTKARRALQNAVRFGKVKREPCATCGTEVNVDAHHTDYSKPLEVSWLCRLCHAAQHRKEGFKRRVGSIDSDSAKSSEALAA